MTLLARLKKAEETLDPALVDGNQMRGLGERMQVRKRAMDQARAAGLRWPAREPREGSLAWRMQQRAANRRAQREAETLARTRHSINDNHTSSDQR